MHRFLVLIEVRSNKGKIDVKDVEAFNTKANDYKADKKAIYASAGFQSGAVNSARRHSIDLFEIYFSKDGISAEQVQDMLTGSTSIAFVNAEGGEIPQPKIRLEKQKGIIFTKIDLKYSDGYRETMPEENTQLTYVVKTSRFGKFESMDQFIRCIPASSGDLDEEKTISLDLPEPTMLIPRDQLFIRGGIVDSVSVTYAMKEITMCHANVQFELTSIANDVVVKNVLTQEVFQLPFNALILGFEDFEEDRFYYRESPLSYYYCESVTGESASVILVESFQMGTMVRCKLRVNKKYGAHYIPLNTNVKSERKIIERLRKRLEQFERL